MLDVAEWKRVGSLGLNWPVSLPVALALGTAILFLSLGTGSDSSVRLILKPAPVLCLAFLVWYQTCEAGGYRNRVTAGLLLGAAGDVLLELSPGCFLHGLTAFLLGHLAYTGAFLQDQRLIAAGRGLLCLLLGTGMFLILHLKGNLDALEFPILAYLLVICAMLWRAASRLGASDVSRFSAWAGFIGALMFVASDAVLSWDLFVNPVPYGGILIMTTYWGGQCGIALSAITRKRRWNGEIEWVRG